MDEGHWALAEDRVRANKRNSRITYSSSTGESSPYPFEVNRSVGYSEYILMSNFCRILPAVVIWVVGITLATTAFLLEMRRHPGNSNNERIDL